MVAFLTAKIVGGRRSFRVSSSVGARLNHNWNYHRASRTDIFSDLARVILTMLAEATDGIASGLPSCMRRAILLYTYTQHQILQSKNRCAKLDIHTES